MAAKIGSIRSGIRTGGGGKPAGLEGSVQYNLDDQFAGDEYLLWDHILTVLTVENLHVPGDTLMEGNLTVNGTIVSIDSESLNIGDSHIYLNASNTALTSSDGGLVVNIGATSTADTVTAGQFTAGVALTSNPTVVTDSSATFAISDLVQVSGTEKNNGLYECLSHVGTLLTIRGIGTTETVETWTNNQFVTDTDTGALTKVNVSVLLTDDNVWQEGTGNQTGITYVPFLQGSGINNEIPLFVSTDGETVDGSGLFVTNYGSNPTLHNQGNVDLIIMNNSESSDLRLMGLHNGEFPTGFAAIGFASFSNEDKISYQETDAEIGIGDGDGFGAITDKASIHFHNDNTVTHGITVTDTLFDAGAVYAADYSDKFVARSLVDKGYVDTQLNGAVYGPISSVVGHLALWDDTTGTLVKDDAPFLISSTGVILNTTTDTVIRSVSPVGTETALTLQSFPENEGPLNFKHLGTLNIAEEVVTLGSYLASSAVISDSVSIILDAQETGVNALEITNSLGKGAVYADDYSSTFVDNSLISKKYADDSFVEGASPVFDNHIVTFDGTTGRLIQDDSGINAHAGKLLSSTTLDITMNQKSTISDVSGHGFVYFADYSNNFTARSLIDKGYVDAQTIDSSSDTQVIFNSSNVLTGSAALTFDSTILSLLGATAAYTVEDGGGTTLAGTSFPGPGAAFHARDLGSNPIPSVIYLESQNLGTSNFAGTLAFQRSRVSTPLVGENDLLGSVVFQGYDGTGYVSAATIEAYVDGTASVNDMPGRLSFKVTPDGSDTAAAALTINEDATSTLHGIASYTGTPVFTADNQLVNKKYVDDEGGDVIGPSGVTDTAVAFFDNSTGKLIDGSPNYLFTPGDGTTTADTITLGTADSTASHGTVFVPNVYETLNLTTPNLHAALHTMGDTTHKGDIFLDFGSTNASAAPHLQYRRYRTAAAPAVVAGTHLGRTEFWGHTTTSYARAAYIQGEVDGQPSTGTMPGRLVFYTTANGFTTPAEALRISADKTVTLHGIASYTGTPVFNNDNELINKKYVDDTAGGTGDVNGPSSAADGGIAIFDGTTGKLIQDVGVSVSTILPFSTHKVVHTNTGSGQLDTSTWHFQSNKSVIFGTNATYGATNNDSPLSGTFPASGAAFHALTSNEASDLYLESHSNADAASSIFRRATQSFSNVVSDNDILGTIDFQGYDSTDFEVAASIHVHVDGAVAEGSMPGRLGFRVTPHGSATPVEALTIHQDATSTFHGLASYTGTPVFTADNQLVNKKYVDESPAGDVVGPSGVTDTAIAFFDSATGKSIDGDASLTWDATNKALTLGTSSAFSDSSVLVYKTTGLSPGQSAPEIDSAFQVIGSPNVEAVAYFDMRGDQAGQGSILNMRRSRTPGSGDAVEDGDCLGEFIFSGNDGSAYIRSAIILAEVDGTPNTNDMPGALVFKTSPSGSGTPIEALRIGPNQIASYPSAPTFSDALEIITKGYVDGIALDSNSDTQLIFNNSGVLSGTNDLTYDYTNQILQLGTGGASHTLAIINGDHLASVTIPDSAASLHALGSGTDTAYWYQDSQTNSVAAGAPQIRMRRGRYSPPHLVQDGDLLGSLNFDAHDGTGYQPSSAILGEIDGTAAADDVPGRLVFMTSADGTSTLTEAMRISGDQTVLLQEIASYAGTPVFTTDNQLVNKKYVDDNAGDVSGPSGVTDTAIAFFDDSTGQLIDGNGSLTFNPLGGAGGTTEVLALGSAGTGTAPSGTKTLIVRTAGTLSPGETYPQPGAALQLKGNAGGADLYIDNNNSGANISPKIVMRRANFGTGLNNNWCIGAIDFEGNDTVANQQAARIYVESDGGAAVDSMPAKIHFAVTPSGTTTAEIAHTINSDKTQTLVGIASYSAELTFSNDNDLITKKYVDDLVIVNSSDKEIIFNNSGVLSGSPGFTFDTTNQVLQLGTGGVSHTLAIINGDHFAGVTIPDSDASIHALGSDANTAYWYQDAQTNEAVDGVSQIRLRRGRYSPPHLVQDGDLLGSINFDGHDGNASYQPAAAIHAEVDGTAAADDMPGSLVFLTSPDGTVVPVEAMRIDGEQKVTLQEIASYSGTPTFTANNQLVNKKYVDDSLFERRTFTHTTTTQALGKVAIYGFRGNSFTVLHISTQTLREASLSHPWEFAVKDEIGYASAENHIKINTAQTSITAVAASGTSWSLFTTSSAHHYMANDIIYQHGFSHDAYNGVFTVTNANTSTTYTVAIAYGGTDTGASQIAIDNTGSVDISADFGIAKFYSNGHQVWTR